MPYTVKKVADMAGLSVRALHHYDAIGLLKPSSTSQAGYRLYSDADLARLQEVLFFRELGFSLDDIKRVLDSPAYDRREALLMHRDLLREKRQRLDVLISTVDKTLKGLEKGKEMTAPELFEGFDLSKGDHYRDEARQRWGSVVDETYARLGSYSKAQQKAMWDEVNGVYRAIGGMIDRDPGDPAVQEEVGKWYRLINDHFWQCSPQAFRALGEMYVQDHRFTENIDKVRPGLAVFLSKAMAVYAGRLESEQQ